MNAPLGLKIFPFLCEQNNGMRTVVEALVILVNISATDRYRMYSQCCSCSSMAHATALYATLWPDFWCVSQIGYFHVQFPLRKAFRWLFVATVTFLASTPFFSENFIFQDDRLIFHHIPAPFRGNGDGWIVIVWRANTAYIERACCMCHLHDDGDYHFYFAIFMFVEASHTVLQSSTALAPRKLYAHFI